jgi:hypothetical protein
MCYFSLAAWVWSVVGASAQEYQVMTQPDGAGSRPAVVQPSSAIPWDTIHWIERRYKIEAMHFTARDESGIDWWGADEVMVRTDDAKGWTVSDEIDDIHTGDTHNFDPAVSCIIPVRPGIVKLGKTSVCDEVGEPTPLGFSVEFWEKDPLPHLGFCSPQLPFGGFHAGPHCEKDSNDDFLGHARIDLTQHDLDVVLLNVGDEYIETVVLNPCSGESVCNVTYGPDYSFTYRITRLPDVRVDLRAVLDDAMRKIGARSELEAIAAGLRSLRAPSPRQIEPGMGK